MSNYVVTGIAVAATCVLAAPAHAGDRDASSDEGHASAMSFMRTVMAEVGPVRQWHGRETGLGARLYVGATGQPIDAGWGSGRLITAIGARIARLRLDAPGLERDARVAGAVATLGLELRVGLRWPGGHYAYVGGGPIVSGVSAHSRAAERVLEGLGYHHGARLAVGAAIFHVHLDLTWERAAGEDRFGVGLGAAL